MAVLHSAALTTTGEYFTVTSAAAPDVYNASGFVEQSGRVFFGRAPDGAPCLVTTVAEGDQKDAVGAYRSEIAAPALTHNVPYLILWESFIPVDFPFNAVSDFNGNEGTYCLMQFHDSPDAGNPIVNLSNLVMFCNNAGKIIAKVPTLASFADKTTTSYYDTYVGPNIILGQWVQCAALVNFSKTSGFIELYYNHEPVVKVWRQRTDYDNTAAPYLRLGVYDFHHLEGFGRMTQYLRNVVVRDGADGYYAAAGKDKTTQQPKQIL